MAPSGSALGVFPPFFAPRDDLVNGCNAAGRTRTGYTVAQTVLRCFFFSHFILGAIMKRVIRVLARAFVGGLPVDGLARCPLHLKEWRRTDPLPPALTGHFDSGVPPLGYNVSYKVTCRVVTQTADPSRRAFARRGRKQHPAGVSSLLLL